MPAVFISHATGDKPAALAVCAALEAAGVPCWIAPRDVRPGRPYPEEIVRGIGECAVLLLLYSAEANRSEMVLRELENAASAKRAILPVKLDDSPPCPEMRFYLGREQWVDARTGTIEPHLARIVEGARALVGQGDSAHGASSGSDRASVPLRGESALRLPRTGCVVQVVVACVAVAGVLLVVLPKRAGGPPDAAAPPGAPGPAGQGLAERVTARIGLPQVRVEAIDTGGGAVVVTGVVAHPEEVTALRERLRGLGESVRIEVRADAAALAREITSRVEGMGLTGVDVNVRGRPGEPPREVIVRYRAKVGVARAEVERLARAYFLRPELVSVVEDP